MPCEPDVGPHRNTLRTRVAKFSQAHRCGVSSFLLKNYAKTRLTAADVCEGAASASGSRSGEIARLARNFAKRPVARRGKLVKDTRHCARGVARVLERRCLLPKPYTVDFPSWDYERSEKTIRAIEVLPPHETLNALITSEPESVQAWCGFLIRNLFSRRLTLMGAARWV